VSGASTTWDATVAIGTMLDPRPRRRRRLPGRRSGESVHMEGGVAIFILLVIAVVAVVLGIALYVTGGAIVGLDKKKKPPPRGKTDPIAENTTAMQTPSQRETSDRS
jgi:hypothetical protein